VLRKVWGTVFIVVGVMFLLYGGYNGLQVLIILLNGSHLPSSVHSAISSLGMKDLFLIGIGFFGALFGSSLLLEEEERRQR
jgi:hypothetical protein